MNDKVIQSYIAEFARRSGVQGLKEKDLFEYFVTYCVLAKLHPDEFEVDDVVLGGEGDTGIDSIGILVNDHLVSSADQVEHHMKTLRRLDVQFVFVQAKTSAHFETGEIGTFLTGVRQFFEDVPPVGANDAVQSFHAVKEHIYHKSIDMDQPPVCRLYYATLGSWNNEQPLAARIGLGVEDLKRTNLFADVQFIALDAEFLKRLYRELNNKIEREILFEKHTILPQIEGKANSGDTTLDSLPRSTSPPPAPDRRFVSFGCGETSVVSPQFTP